MAAVEPEPADVVAFIRATLDEDQDAARGLLKSAGGLVLLSNVIDVADQWGQTT